MFKQENLLSWKKALISLCYFRQSPVADGSYRTHARHLTEMSRADKCNSISVYRFRSLAIFINQVGRNRCSAFSASHSNEWCNLLLSSSLEVYVSYLLVIIMCHADMRARVGVVGEGSGGGAARGDIIGHHAQSARHTYNSKTDTFDSVSTMHREFPFSCLEWIYCPGYAGVRDNERMDMLASWAPVAGTIRVDQGGTVKTVTPLHKDPDRGYGASL